MAVEWYVKHGMGPRWLFINAKQYDMYEKAQSACQGVES
jgi:hypothetical protein